MVREQSTEAIRCEVCGGGFMPLYSLEPCPFCDLCKATNEVNRLRLLLDKCESMMDRLIYALNEAAEMIEHEADRTLIVNHCKQAAERGIDA